MGEEWLPIEEFPNYLISNTGLVYSLITDKILKPGGTTKGGYNQAHFGSRKNRKIRYIHRLVAAAFLEESIIGMEVDHLDDDTQNNNDWNLEVVTPKVNSQRAYDRGSRLPPSMIGIRIIETGEVFRSISDCAKFLNRSLSSTHYALHNETPVAGYHIERAMI